MWAWEHPNWPKFVIDEGAFAGRVEAFHRTAERLFGNVEVMGDEGRADTEIELMLSEAIATSAIEGENLDRDSVRSSLQMGPPPDTRNVGCLAIDGHPGKAVQHGDARGVS